MRGRTANRVDGAADPATPWTAEPDRPTHCAVAGEKSAGHRAARVAVGAWQVRGAGQHRACGESVEATRLASEKKSIHATERDTEENRGRREAFVDELRTIAPEDLIYLDESGVSTQMTRTYARAPRGQRVHAAVPGSCWKMVTILGAMDCNGMLAAMTVEAATDREVFLEYLDQVLCPKLRSGHVVVMDNLSAHKVDGARERIEQTGARLLYLPPYSPDLNPIEKAWAKLKQALRAAGARTAEALHQAVADLLPTITPQDATAWFRLPLKSLY
jgi:transposase